MKYLPGIAACLLLVLGCSSRESVEWTPLDDLLARLNDPSADLRYSALREIKEQGPGTAQKAVPQIIAALKDRDATVRYGAALAVPLCGHEAAAAVPTLIDMLQDKDPLVRAAAAAAFPALGPKSREAVPALQNLIQDREKRVREAATHALKQIANNAKYSSS